MRNHDIIPYTQNARLLASQLRKNMTPAELVFWSVFKSSKLGVVVRRQVPILDYVVDFYIKELGLAIEIDGDYHKDNTLEDGLRQDRIEKLGVKIIRFSNEDILDNLPQVIEHLKSLIIQFK
jgi:very-short-patch-repair endonuclease